MLLLKPEKEMKKLVLVITMLVAATSASAQWHHRYPERTVIVERNDWVAPLILGGIAGAVIANANQPQTVVQQQPVIVQRPVIVQQPATVCTDWKEIQTPDGQIYRERNCYQR
jgi:hypothetical protein